MTYIVERMKVLAGILALCLTLPAAVAQLPTRPLADIRNLVALVPEVDGVDAYWLHVDELSTPYLPMVLRTPLLPDGTPTALPKIVRADATLGSANIGDSIVLWRSSDGAVRTSALHNGALADPAGKLIAEGSYITARLTCGASQCAATWDGIGGVLHTAFLDGEGSVASGPFFLPETTYVLAATMSDNGLLLARSIRGGVYATLIDRNGVVRFDQLLFQIDPLRNPTPNVALVDDGSRWVAAWVERPWSALQPSNEVRAAAINRAGEVMALPALLTVQQGLSIGPLALAWNGRQYLLVTSYDDGRATNSLYGLRYDANLSPLAPVPSIPRQPFGTTTTAIAAGDRFFIGWNSFRPMVATVSASGDISTPMAVDLAARRRSAR